MTLNGQYAHPLDKAAIREPFVCTVRFDMVFLGGTSLSRTVAIE